jgi:hypothetical protein
MSNEERDIEALLFKIRMQEQSITELSNAFGRMNNLSRVLWDGAMERQRKDHRKHAIAIWCLALSTILLGIAHVI